MAAKIVVGVTEASAASRALTWAAQRGAALGEPLELIAVIGGMVGAIGEDSVLETALEDAEALLAREAARAKELGAEASTQIQRGNPVQVLIEAGQDASLLVIGSDYRGPGSGPVRGAHGLRIAAAAPCPVVVVPDIEPGAREGVVVGVDGSPVSEQAIVFAAAEADRLGEPLVAVTVWTPLEAPRNPGVYPEDYLLNMQRLSEEAQAVSLAGIRQDYPDLKIVSRVERGYPSQVINAVAESAQLTVLGSHGRGAIARFLLGSISHEVLGRLAAPTAVVR